MSAEALNYVVGESQTHGAERLVMLVLAHEADDVGRINTTVGRIIRGTALTGTQVAEALEAIGGRLELEFTDPAALKEVHSALDLATRVVRFRITLGPWRPLPPDWLLDARTPREDPPPAG